MIEEFLHILTDPAHMLAEVVSHIVIEALILGIIWPFVKRAVRKHDRKVHEVRADPICDPLGIELDRDVTDVVMYQYDDDIEKAKAR